MYAVPKLRVRNASSPGMTTLLSQTNMGAMATSSQPQSKAMAKGNAPSRWLVHLALIGTQVMFGAGGVIGKLGLPSFNPLLFALIREGTAGPLLMGASLLLTPTRVADVVREWKEFLWLGLFIYGNQLLFIIGLKLSNPVAGSIWQPSQPVFTSAIAIWLGWEAPSARRIGGIVVAFVGCALMVYLSSSDSSSKSLVNELVGNVFFFFNCLATSLYVIKSKPLLRRFPALAVTAWSYMIASLLMLATAVTLNNLRPCLDFLCPDCEGQGWRVPVAALPALARGTGSPTKGGASLSLLNVGGVKDARSDHHESPGRTR